MWERLQAATLQTGFSGFLNFFAEGRGEVGQAVVCASASNAKGSGFKSWLRLNSLHACIGFS